MTFQQYWTILLKQWRLIVISFLAVGLGTYIGSKLTTPIYQSTALVQIAIRSGNNQTDINNLLASNQLVQTEAVLATSDPVLREVASHYPGLTVEQLSREATATPILNTQLFEITVQDPSPTSAATFANDIAATLIKQQFQITQQEDGRARQQLQAAQNDNFLRIVQDAHPILSPVRPTTLLNTSAGLLTGLLLGMLLAVLFEQFDTRVRTQEALAQLLDWPILATIWLARSSSKKGKETVIHPTGSDANAESYRNLRTTIGFSVIDKPVRSLVVTSALPGEGKSVVATNLAISMAKAGKSTLLIDADLHHPTLHQQFDLPADKLGLSNAVLSLSMPPLANSSSHYQALSPPSLKPQASTTPTSDVSLEPFIHSVDIPNLWVMPSGPLPPNPSELLDSKAMQRLFAAIASYEFEAVIFDTSPLLGLSDARILASKVDGTLVVVDISRANKRSLKQMKASLMHTPAYVLGCIVNKQPHTRKDVSYYYYIDKQNNEEYHSTMNVTSVQTKIQSK